MDLWLFFPLFVLQTKVKSGNECLATGILIVERERGRGRGGGERERAPFFLVRESQRPPVDGKKKERNEIWTSLLRLEAFVERHRFSSLNFFPRSFSSCRRSTSMTSGTRASAAAAPLSSSPRSSGPGAAGDGETDGGGRERERTSQREALSTSTEASSTSTAATSTSTSDLNSHVFPPSLTNPNQKIRTQAPRLRFPRHRVPLKAWKHPPRI